MQLADIPTTEPGWMYLILADSESRVHAGVEVVGWTTSALDAVWWQSRPGMRVMKARPVTFADNGEEA